MATTPKGLEVRGAVRRMIEEAAYYKAERRGFAPGQEMDDWLEAEREIVGAEELAANQAHSAGPGEKKAGKP